jgi:hypothetical protein
MLKHGEMCLLLELCKFWSKSNYGSYGLHLYSYYLQRNDFIWTSNISSDFFLAIALLCGIEAEIEAFKDRESTMYLLFAKSFLWPMLICYKRKTLFCA